MNEKLSEQEAKEFGEIFDTVRRELHQSVVGQDNLIDRLLVALLANGHVLLEGVPGLAKTRTLAALTSCIDLEMQRVQFTPDLLPSDLIGTEVFRPQSGEFVTRLGPIFTNLLLADEINRAPAKVQSALLQAMQERQVTIGERTHLLPEPFLVLATQNPIEQEGTYPLPEAQLDRFLMKIKVSYPSQEEELKILEMVHRESVAPRALSAVIGKDSLQRLREATARVFVDPLVDRYIVALVRATREGQNYGMKGLIDWGASPRASIALQSSSRAFALLRGRHFVSPDEVKLLAPDILRHRILPSFEAEAQGIDAEKIVEQLLSKVPVP